MLRDTISFVRKERLAYLDALKCLGILLVISGHVQFFGMGIEAYDSLSTLMLYSFNMPLFFFVSGYLAFKENAVGKLYELKNIGIKFIFLVFPAIAFYCFAKFLEQGAGCLNFFYEGFGKYWFTFTLFEMFMVYYVINWISKSKWMLALLLTILSVVCIGYLSLYSKYEIAFFDFNHFAKYIQFFTLGVLAKMFAEQYDKLMQNEYLKTIAIISFFVLLVSLFKIQMPGAIFHFLRDIVLRYLGLYIVVSLFYCNQGIFNKENRLNQLIMKIGQNSLAIYLLQYFFVPNFMAFPVWLSGLDWLSIYAVSFVYTAFIIAICMVFIKLLSNSVFVKRYILGRK